ncbi:MAG: glutamate 5-kinase [Prevotella sp.]|nr:glutamate 5-kinase [Prevotella sp.]
MPNRIVVKVGSNVLTRDNGKLDITRMSALTDQLAWLYNLGYEVILVSSGSVTCGRGVFKSNRKLDSVEQRQLFSAIGQVKLINLYYDLFREHSIPVGQVLTTKENFASRRLYLNQRACMEVMILNGVIPIVNENDTVSLTELMFTDNDELSGLIASMMDAKALIILTNVDGIYNGSPNDPASHIISSVKQGTHLQEYIQNEKSIFGRGGMASKCFFAQKVADEGIKTIIANGKRENILTNLFLHPDNTPHTEFVPAAQPASNVKKWIAHSGSFACGAVHVNAKAADTLRGNKAVSLLLVGVTDIEGDFEKGDIISVIDPNGNKLAVGRSSYDSNEARANIGKHDIKPLVHYDYLCLE